MKPSACLVALLLLASSVVAVRGQDGTASEKFVSQDEYQKLKADHEKLEKELETLKAQMQQFLQQGVAAGGDALRAKLQDLEKKAAAKQVETDQTLDEMDKELQKVKMMAKETSPGTTRFLVGGYGTGGFDIENQGGGKKAYATFNPLFLWKLSDRLLFEGELEAELEGHETHMALEVAQISYLLNDYMTLGAGKFLNPINFFVERQHMGWVNKLPDKPLGIYDGFLPEDLVGAQIRGGIPVGPTKLGYAFFIANAPELKVGPNNDDPTDATELGGFQFDNFDNLGNRFSIGGRVGFLPIPALEVGYGFQWADVSPPNAARSVKALFQSVDLSYVRDSETLRGIVNFKAQWAWSSVDRYTYDPDGLAGGPFNFNNKRDGGYIQLSYHPTKIEQPWLQNFEPVVRFDMLNQKETPSGFDEHRVHLGLDYWLGPSSVFKAAYVFVRESGPAADAHDVLQLQLVAGF